MKLLFTPEAKSILHDLDSSPQYSKKLSKVRKALAFLEQDPRHPSLNSHKYQSLKGVDNTDVWESYVENRTPGAWRIFWQYGKEPNTLVVLIIGPHPD
jgi:hypothetical protein